MSSIRNPLEMMNSGQYLGQSKLEELQRKKRLLEGADGTSEKDDAQVWAVAQGFEEIFLNIMMKSMNGTMDDDGEGFMQDSHQTKMMRDMYHAELSHEMSQRKDGLGIAQMVYDFVTDGAAPVRPPVRSYTPSRSQGFVMPVQGRLSSPFGMRQHPISGEMKFHHGVDIAASAGTPIRSAKGGTVVFSGQQRGYGNVVILDHGHGTRTLYGHNQSNLVKEGDTVRAGQPIGLVGSTGASTGPHLHFEVQRNGEKVNPSKYLKEI